MCKWLSFGHFGLTFENLNWNYFGPFSSIRTTPNIVRVSFSFFVLLALCLSISFSVKLFLSSPLCITLSDSFTFHITEKECEIEKGEKTNKNTEFDIPFRFIQIVGTNFCRTFLWYCCCCCCCMLRVDAIVAHINQSILFWVCGVL